MNNVEELLNAVKTFCEEDPMMVDEETGELIAIEGVVTLDRFLQDVALLTDQDEKKEEADADKVTLSQRIGVPLRVRGRMRGKPVPCRAKPQYEGRSGGRKTAFLRGGDPGGEGSLAVLRQPPDALG